MKAFSNEVTVDVNNDKIRIGVRGFHVKLSVMEARKLILKLQLALSIIGSL